MTRAASRSLGLVVTGFVVSCAVMLAGCASLGPATPVAVSDIRTVTGTWKGTVYPSGLAAEAITLTIREDGSYDVASAQEPLGVSGGRGRITLNDGRVVFEGERGRGAGTVLTDRAGHLVMNVDAILSDNSTLSAKLARTD
jgi:hypothetical protein